GWISAFKTCRNPYDRVRTLPVSLTGFKKVSQPTSLKADFKATDAPLATAREVLNLNLLQRGKPAASWFLINRLFRSYLRTQIPAFLVAFVFMAIASGMTALFPHALEFVVNGMIGLSGFTYMVELALLIVCLFFVRGITTYAHTVIM